MYVLYAGIVIIAGSLFLELKFIYIQFKYVVAFARLMYCEIKHADRWTGCTSPLYVPFMCIVRRTHRTSRKAEANIGSPLCT